MNTVDKQPNLYIVNSASPWIDYSNESELDLAIVICDLALGDDIDQVINYAKDLEEHRKIDNYDRPSPELVIYTSLEEVVTQVIDNCENENNSFYNPNQEDNIRSLMHKLMAQHARLQAVLDKGFEEDIPLESSNDN
jgi:hypothetical protein